MSKVHKTHCSETIACVTSIYSIKLMQLISHALATTFGHLFGGCMCMYVCTIQVYYGST